MLHMGLNRGQTNLRSGQWVAAEGTAGQVLHTRCVSIQSTDSASGLDQWTTDHTRGWGGLGRSEAAC